MWRTHRNGAVALALAVALTGCDTETTGPEDPQTFDAEAALADYDALATALEADDLDPFRALPGRTPFASSAAAAGALSDLGRASAGGGGRAYAAELARALLDLSPAGSDGPAAAPVISPFHRGTTFVYDPQVGEYRPDPDRAGAPADGVRFILYDLAPDGTPILEEEVGWADLVDEGDASAESVALRLEVVDRGDVVLDYRTTVQWGDGQAAVTVDGFLVGDGVRMDFQVSLEGREGDGLKESALSFEVAVEARDFVVTGRVEALEEGPAGSGSFELDIRHGADRMQVAATGDDGVIDGTVSLQGEPFAVFQGPEDDLEVTAPDGTPLTALEALAFHRAVDVIEDVFDFVEDLLDPVDDIVLLGIVL